MDVICLVACLLGLIFIVRPGNTVSLLNKIFNLNYQINETSPLKISILLLVVASSFIKACEDMIMKSLCAKIDPILLPLAYSAISFLIYPVILFCSGGSILLSIDLNTWLLIVLISILQYITQYLHALSLQSEAVGRASLVNYLQLVILVLADLCFFSKSVVFYDMIGTLLIFGFNFANGILKFFTRLEKKKFFNKLILTNI